MFETNNKTTQPLKTMPIFNNWDVVTQAWYCVGEVAQLDKKNILATQIGQQQLVIFKTREQKIHCLDAFCSHMGLHLGTGEVVGNELRCQFHHWRYNGQGEVSACQKLSENRNINSYPVEIRYGLIWIWAGQEASYPLPFHPHLTDGAFHFKRGPRYTRPSHPHISLLNALDTQHVNTVHALDLKVTSQQYEDEQGQFIHYDFEGKFYKKKSIFLTGGSYRFSVRYVGATIGFLKALDGIKLFSRIPFPPIYATFGYRPLNQNQTEIRPIFLTPKRKGLLGWIKSLLHLWITEMIYNRLKGEDGVIYENIRFTPHLTAEDKNIASFISHVNRLKKSDF